MVLLDATHMGYTPVCVCVCVCVWCVCVCVCVWCVCVCVCVDAYVYSRNARSKLLVSSE